MSDLQWTDEPPEEEGWYWLKDDEMSPLSPRIVEVEYSTIDQELIVSDPIDGTGIQRGLHEYSDAQWAGPIPEPKPNKD
jgi:hypothetical protein